MPEVEHDPPFPRHGASADSQAWFQNLATNLNSLPGACSIEYTERLIAPGE